MQNDQSFGSFADPSQVIGAMAGSHEDHFWLPNVEGNMGADFWDLPPDMSMNLGMDMDFGAASAPVFPSGTPSHRHSASFDWNQEVPLFQEPQGQAQANHFTSPRLNITSPIQVNGPPQRRQRALAPKPPATEQMSLPGHINPHMRTASNLPSSHGMQPGVSFPVDPHLLPSRPPSSAMDMSFNMPGATTSDLGNGNPGVLASDSRRPATLKGRAPDRATASSPIKPLSGRPKLARSMSENRGRRTTTRAPIIHQPSASRPGSSITNDGSAPRASGRMSPLKRRNRLSGLASIPESTLRSGSRPAVQFIIDARGHARAEYTKPDSSLVMSRSAIDLSQHRLVDDSAGSSSEDDEPIMIPSRNNSFNASFALPDPRKPVGSIFHSARRSLSDRSTSTEGNSRAPLDIESEAETVLGEPQEPSGNAASELLKVVGSRQKRSLYNSSKLSHQYNPLVSPTSLGEPSYDLDRQEVRCVCNRDGTNPADGFMIQCESCEMWLHGQCINLTHQSMPRVYICAFCAGTPHNRVAPSRGQTASLPGRSAFRPPLR